LIDHLVEMQIYFGQLNRASKHEMQDPDAGTAAEVHQDQESRRFACDSNPIATLIEQNE
jgi:hypothetical protein